PFELGGEPIPGPAGKGIGLVIADMGHRRGEVDRPEANQAHLHVAAFRLFEIKRPLPTLAVHRVPAVCEPKRRRGIAAVLGELDPLGVGHAARGELERTDQLLVTRAFVVIGEAIAIMPDLEDPAVKGHEGWRRSLARGHAGPRLAIGRLERFCGEWRKNVGEEQLLVLLLVIDAELDELSRLGPKRLLEQPAKRLVDESTIGTHLIGGGTRKQAAFGTWLPRAYALVIGVEAIFEALVEHLVAGKKAFQDEGFKEPGGVREMPFGWARVVHDLDDLVLVA